MQIFVVLIISRKIHLMQILLLEQCLEIYLQCKSLLYKQYLEVYIQYQSLLYKRYLQLYIQYQSLLFKLKQFCIV